MSQNEKNIIKSICAHGALDEQIIEIPPEVIFVTLAKLGSCIFDTYALLAYKKLIHESNLIECLQNPEKKFK